MVLSKSLNIKNELLSQKLESSFRLAVLYEIVLSRNQKQQKERREMTPTMVIQTSHEPPCEVKMFKFNRGEVYTTRLCKKIAPRRHGQQGFRVVGDADVPVLQMVTFLSQNGDGGNWVTMEMLAQIKKQRYEKWRTERALFEYCLRMKRRRRILGCEYVDLTQD